MKKFKIFSVIAIFIISTILYLDNNEYVNAESDFVSEEIGLEDTLPEDTTTSVSGGAIVPEKEDVVEEEEIEEEPEEKIEEPIEEEIIYSWSPTEEYVSDIGVVSNKRMSLMSSGGHTHTDECYSGHRHIDKLSGIDINSNPIRIRDDRYVSKTYNGTLYQSTFRIAIICAQCNSEIYAFSIFNTNNEFVDVYTVYKGEFKFKKIKHGGLDSSGRYSDYTKSVIYSQFAQYASLAHSIQDGNYTDTDRNQYLSGAFIYNLAGLPEWDDSGNISYKPFEGCHYRNNFGHSMNENACYMLGKKTKVKLSGRVYYSDNHDTVQVIATCNDCNKEVVNITYVMYSPGGSSSGMSRTDLFLRFSTWNSSGAIQTPTISTYVGAHLGSTDREWDILRGFSSTIYRPFRDMYSAFGSYGNASGSISTGPVDFPLSTIFLKCGAYLDSVLQKIPYLGCAYCGTFDTVYSCNQEADTTTECSQVVLSITPEASTQTVYQGNSINTKAIATYLDGSTAVVDCTTSFVANVVQNNQTAVLTYSGLVNNAKTAGSVTTTLSVNVIPGLSSISVTPTASTVYNGTVPMYTVVAHYLDGATKVLSSGQYTLTGWSDGYGTKNLVFTYTEGIKTVTEDISITVLPNVTGLSIIPDKSSVLYGQSTTYSFRATYEDETSKLVDANITKDLVSVDLGVQEVIAHYTENSRTVSASCNIEILDYPTELNITLANDFIFQGQLVSVEASSVILASGATMSDIGFSESSYDNMTVGNKDIIYSYMLNDVEVVHNKTVEVRVDLVDININTDNITIYREQELPIIVTAITNTQGEIVISKGDYIIEGFDNTEYDRVSKSYTVSYTYKGITRVKTIHITVLPNVVSISVTTQPETVENVFIKFEAIVKFEDGKEVILSSTGDGLTVENYELDKVGYQTINFVYKKGNVTFSVQKTIRVRAIINISIPLNVLLEINPNTDSTVTSSIIIDNKSKEGVIVSILSVEKGEGNTLRDVEPTKHSNWDKLGKSDSNDIAIGFDYKDIWNKTVLHEPLYITNIKSPKEIGVISKNSSNTLKIVTLHGTAFNTIVNFSYKINWSIRIID